MNKFLMLSLIMSISPLSVFAAPTLEDQIKAQQEQIQKLDERLTDSELKSIKDRINFGIDLKVDSALMNDKAKIEGSDAISHSGYVGSLLFRLNADTNIGEKINVYAAIESLSFFNENLFYGPANITNRENQAKGDKLSLVKAYFDWKIYQNWLTFTAGRLPTTKGPPAHIKDGVGREGTYPVTGYSIPLDGFAFTAKLSTPLELKDNLSVRFIYKPGGTENSVFPFRGVSLGDNIHPERVAKNHQLFSGMIEFEQTENRNRPWEKMLAILQFGYFKFASPPSFTTSGLMGSGDNDQYRVYFDNDKFIDAKILSPYLELNKVLHTQFDYYATFSFTRSETHAHARAVKIAGPGTSIPAGYDFQVGPFIHEGKATGTRFITGTRYEFPNRFFLGVEYMKSTEKALPTVFYADSPFSPNYLNGHSYEVYVLKNFYHDNFIVRMSYTQMNINADLSNGLFFQNTVETIKVGALSFNIKI